jgi:rubrerythrin
MSNASDTQSGEWWAKVNHQFASHVRQETSFLQEYEDLVERVGDAGIAFLLRMILEDERRHHELFEEMSRAALGEEDALPAAPAPDRATAVALLEPTERFLAAERDDQVTLRRLRKELKPARDDTLWPLLVELMEIDTEKHIRVLEYLRQRLRAATKDER